MIKEPKAYLVQFKLQDGTYEEMVFTDKKSANMLCDKGEVIPLYDRTNDDTALLDLCLRAMEQHDSGLIDDACCELKLRLGVHK